MHSCSRLDVHNTGALARTARERTLSRQKFIRPVGGGGRVTQLLELRIGVEIRRSEVRTLGRGDGVAQLVRRRIGFEIQRSEGSNPGRLRKEHEEK